MKVEHDAGGAKPARRFFDALDEQTRLRVTEHARRVSYAAGEAIVRQGDPATEVFILLSGRCDVLVGDGVVNHMEANELFGEIGSLGEGLRTATVVAAVPVEALAIPSETFHNLIEGSPRASSLLLKAMASRTQRISHREAQAHREHLELQALERSLLPSADVFARSARFALEAHWQPLTYASGDYCDVVALGAERYLVAIGDVVGHGARTALTLATLRGQLNELALQGEGPASALTRLDRYLSQHGPENMPASLAVVAIDGETMTATCCSAGHPAPLLYRGGEVDELGTGRGPLLGYGFGHASGYEDETVELQAGDRILLFTDGLSEASRGPAARRELLGEEGLRTALLDLCTTRPEQILQPLFAAVERYRDGHERRDDATAMLLYVE